ncbi:MAG: hypothetical protein K6U03_01820 [Firmicutes bacterium]|nr:hypothetical protein [Bacillota bacterium]
MMENLEFYELSPDELMMIDGGKDWGKVVTGASIIGGAVLAVGLAAVAAPAVIPLSAMVTIAVGGFLTGATGGFLISNGLRK